MRGGWHGILCSVAVFVPSVTVNCKTAVLLVRLPVPSLTATVHKGCCPGACTQLGHLWSPTFVTVAGTANDTLQGKPLENVLREREAILLDNRRLGPAAPAHAQHIWGRCPELGVLLPQLLDRDLSTMYRPGAVQTTVPWASTTPLMAQWPRGARTQEARSCLGLSGRHDGREPQGHRPVSATGEGVLPEPGQCHLSCPSTRAEGEGSVRAAVDQT